MNAKKILIGAFTLAGVILAGAFLSGSFGTLPWMVNRATGLVAFALLSVVVVAGLLMSTKTGAKLIKRPPVFALHQFLSLLTVGFIAAHGLALLFDGFIAMGPVQVLVPFAASYQRFWTGMGVTAAWATAIVWASWYIRGEISTKRWRQLHYLSFISYFMALGHGVFGGTDTGEPLVAALYIVSISSVAAFVLYRIAGAAARRFVSVPPAGMRSFATGTAGAVTAPSITVPASVVRRSAANR